MEAIAWNIEGQALEIVYGDGRVHNVNLADCNDVTLHLVVKDKRPSVGSYSFPVVEAAATYDIGVMTQDTPSVRGMWTLCLHMNDGRMVAASMADLKSTNDLNTALGVAELFRKAWKIFLPA